jgi:hypothetical protein
MVLQYITSFLAGAIAYHGFVKWLKQAPPVQNSSREQLKNALLTFALGRVDGDKFDNGALGMQYDKYNGDSLPTLSGADLNMACFSYIINKEEFRRDPWYTEIMEKKLDAINRYLDTHLGTDEQVSEFFERFIVMYESAPETTEA